MNTRVPVTRHMQRVLRRPHQLWSVAVAGVVCLYAGLYPFIEELDMEAMVSDLPEGLSEALGYDQIGTAAGYISSSVFGLLGPILLLVFGIGLGVKLIAGQEEDGTLELELTGPTSRQRIYLERLLVLFMGLLQQVLVTFAVLLLLNTVAGLNIDFNKIAFMCVALWLFSSAFGALAMGIGAATGRRSLALGVAAGLAMLSFMFDALGPTLHQNWMTNVSPWSWYIKDSPLLHDPNVTSLTLLAVMTIVGAVFGIVGFQRRDLLV